MAADMHFAGAGQPPAGGRLTVRVRDLEDNAGVVRAHATGTAIPVLKGDGYGLGLASSAAAFRSAGFEFMAVGTIADAEALAGSESAARMLVLADTPRPSGLAVEWLVGEPEIRTVVDRWAGEQLRLHIDVDFGLGRGGVRTAELAETIRLLRSIPGVEILGLAGQLPGGSSRSAVSQAVGVLLAARPLCPSAMLHIGGSDAIRWAGLVPEVAIRTGRLLCGVRPRQSPRWCDPIRAAWAWTATAWPFTSPPRTGYAGRRASEGMPVRIDLGFAHGMPVQAADRWPVIVSETPYVIGSVFMNCCIAFPVGADAPSSEPMQALLSGSEDGLNVDVREIADALGVATTVVLTSPRPALRTIA